MMRSPLLNVRLVVLLFLLLVSALMHIRWLILASIARATEDSTLLQDALSAMSAEDPTEMFTLGSSILLSKHSNYLHVKAQMLNAWLILESFAKLMEDSISLLDACIATVASALVETFTISRTSIKTVSFHRFFLRSAVSSKHSISFPLPSKHGAKTSIGPHSIRVPFDLFCACFYSHSPGFARDLTSRTSSKTLLRTTCLVEATRSAHSRGCTISDNFLHHAIFVQDGELRILRAVAAEGLGITTRVKCNSSATNTVTNCKALWTTEERKV